MCPLLFENYNIEDLKKVFAEALKWTDSNSDRIMENEHGKKNIFLFSILYIYI